MASQGNDADRDQGEAEKHVDELDSLVAGRHPKELAELVHSRLRQDMDYARHHRTSWRRMASATHLVTLSFSAASTVILGIADLEPLAEVGFVFSALVTTASAVEPYFNWRARWVLAEEALAAWYKLEEDIINYVAETPAGALSTHVIMNIDRERQEVWRRLSDQWLKARRAGAAPR